MENTMQLLNKALQVKRASHWANELNLSNGTFTMAKTRGRLSPTLAGNLAMKLGEDAKKWIAIAAIEAEPESEQLELLKTHEKEWLFT